MSNTSKWSPKRLLITSGIAAVAVSLAFAVPQVVSARLAQRQQVLSNLMVERGVPYLEQEAQEIYRGQYLTILRNLEEVSSIYGIETPVDGLPGMGASQSATARGIAAVQELTDEELTVMMEFSPDITPLLFATADLVSIARADRAMQYSSTALVGASRTSRGIPGGGQIESGGFPSAPYSAEVGSTRPSTGAALAASATFETADGVREVASRGCDQVVVAIGAGGNGSAACIAVDLVWIAAKFVWFAVGFETEDVDSAEILGTYNRVGHLHTDLESLQTSVNTHDASLTAHDLNVERKIAAHDLNIDNDLAAHDSNIDSDLAAHDANIDGDLIAHDIAIQSLLGGVQETLDNEIEKQQVHLQAIKIASRYRYMIVATEAGLPVNVGFDAIEVYDEVGKSFIPLGSASVTQVDVGIYEIGMFLGPIGPSQIFRVKVTHADVFDHYGQIVFHRDSNSL